MRIRPFLELARPANVVTAFADVMTGYAASGAASSLFEGGAFPQAVDLFFLLLSTAGLYAGGVVFNDVFDAELDAVERPERAIPSGRVSRAHAAVFGSALLVVGISAAGFVGLVPFVIACSVGAGALLYDAAAKHHTVWGPVTMGACRGGNLLLGAAAVPAVLEEIWFIACLPIAYIGAVTTMSRGEVHGGTRGTGILAVVLAAAVACALLLLGVWLDYRTLSAIPFLVVFVLLVFPPFVAAASEPTPERIRMAVKGGVLALVAMDATMAAGFGGWAMGLSVLSLLPISMGIARVYAVT